MPLREYLEGLAFFVPILAACGFTATLIARRRYAHLRGAERALAWALLASLALLAAHVLPLALGILARGTALAAALGVAAGSLLIRPRAEPEDPAPPPFAPPASFASMALAALGLAILATFLVAQLRTTLVTPVNHVDVVSFHLPGVARWIQSGSLWQVDQLFPEHVTAYYPNNGDALLLAVVLPWREVAFARLLPVVFLLLAALAVYAIARRLGAPRPTGALAAATLVSLPSAVFYALEGLPDAVMLFGFATGVLFLLRHRDGGRGSDLVLAGLGLGLAFGTKWYGLTVTAAVFVVWVSGRLLARDRARQIAGDAGVLIALIAAASGIWFIRNLIEVGNPIYPQEVGAFGLTVFQGTTEAAVDKTGYALVGYLDEPGVLADYAGPSLWSQLGIAGPLILVAVLGAVGAGAVLRRGFDDRRGRHILALSAVVLLVLVLWMITPGSAPGLPGQPQVQITVRWLIPAALLGVAVLAGIGGRLGRAAVAIDALFVAMIVHAISLLYTHVSASVLAKSATAVFVATALALEGWRTRDRLAVLSRTRLRLAAAVAGLAIVVGASLLRWEQSRYTDQGYYAYEPPFSWIYEHTPPGTKVAIAGGSSLDGVSPILPAFGPRLRNDVRYVGRFDDGLLLEYENRDDFLGSLERDDDALLIVGRGLIPKPEVKEERWARSAGFRKVSESRRLALYVAPSAAADLIRREPGRSADRPAGSS